MTRRILALALAAALPTVNLSGCLPFGNSGPSARVIKHVVVIFGENISFDHYFGTYPVAMNPKGEPAFTALRGTPIPNGLAGLLTSNPNLNPANGAGATNPFRLDRSQAQTADQDHSYSPEQQAFDQGKMDLFPLSVGAADSAAIATATGAAAIAKTTGLTMGYFDGNTVTAMWNYAQHYALSDNSYDSQFGPSTPGAINLISGQTNGVINDSNAGGDVTDDGYGHSTLVSDADPTGDVCSTTTGGTVHMTGHNVGDMLTAANVTWGWFEGGFDLTLTNPNGTNGCKRSTVSPVTNLAEADYVPHHQPFQYYATTANPNHTRPTSIATIGTNTDPANHQYDTHDFFDALSAGNLPGVSFLKAPSYEDAHAGNSNPVDEQRFVVDTINALQKSPYWDSTAVILAYDDSDGWYDHASNIINASNSPADLKVNGTSVCATVGQHGGSDSTLPGVNPATLHAQGRCGYGPRLPLMVISPWAKKNYIDSTVTDQSSVMRFIEDTFLGGTRIGEGSFDSIAGTLNNMFDFNVLKPQNDRTVLLDDSTGEVISGN